MSTWGERRDELLKTINITPKILDLLESIDVSLDNSGTRFEV